MKLARFIAPLILLAPAPAPALTQDVQEVLWGFDGRVVPSRFNLLSIYMHNPTPKPLDLMLVLTRRLGQGMRVGARLVERCYLAPYSGRWVQFHPYSASEYDSWSLRWGGRVMNLPQPRAGTPAVVSLDATGLIGRRTAGLHGFPEARFPTSVTATDGLHAVVLDHEPDWDAPRRQAFLNWLRRGGRLHLLKESSAYPQFSAALSVLNEPSDRFRVHAGLVTRHPFLRGELDASQVHSFTEAASYVRNRHQISWSVASSITDVLRGLVRPTHDWGLIYFVGVVFLLLVGPVHWLLSRRRLDYRGSILFLLVTVLVASYILFEIGKRGYGERAKVHTIGYARHLGEGNYDVTQYSNVFVTTGDQYHITHAAEHNLYSTVQLHEAVPGTIHNGKDGAFDVDIPLFSSRSFVHRGVMVAEGIDVSVERWPEDQRLDQLILRGLLLKKGAHFPERVHQIWALSGTHMCEMRQLGQFLQAHGKISRYREVLDFDDVQRVGFSRYGGRYGPVYDSEQQAPVLDHVRKLVNPVLAKHLGLLLGNSSRPLTEEGHLWLFILAPSPEGFLATGGDLGEDISYVIYHLDVFQ